MQESGKINYLIKECRQKALLDKLYKKQTIDLDNFFKYSGRIEKGKRFKIITNGDR